MENNDGELFFITGGTENLNENDEKNLPIVSEWKIDTQFKYGIFVPSISPGQNKREKNVQENRSVYWIHCMGFTFHYAYSLKSRCDLF